MSDQSAPAGGIPLLGEQAVAILEQRATQLGINCTVCGLEMSGPGFEFVSMRVEAGEEERPKVIEERAFICHREECAEAREKLRSRATAVRPAGGWEVLTGPAKGGGDGERD